MESSPVYLTTIDALTDDVVPSQRINRAILEGYVDWLGAQGLSSVNNCLTGERPSRGHPHHGARRQI